MCKGKILNVTPLAQLVVFFGQMPDKWDFVLVCDDHEPFSKKMIKKKEFLEELCKKGFIIKVRWVFLKVFF